MFLGGLLSSMFACFLLPLVKAEAGSLHPFILIRTCTDMTTIRLWVTGYLATVKKKKKKSAKIAKH